MHMFFELYSAITKLIFRFDDDKDIGALYGELWEDIPSSERVTLQLYLPEIISLLCDSMSSSSWAGKRKVKPLFHYFTVYTHKSIIAWNTLTILCATCSQPRL